MPDPVPNQEFISNLKTLIRLKSGTDRFFMQSIVGNLPPKVRGKIDPGVLLMLYKQDIPNVQVADVPVPTMQKLREDLLTMMTAFSNGKNDKIAKDPRRARMLAGIYLGLGGDKQIASLLRRAQKQQQQQA